MPQFSYSSTSETTKQHKITFCCFCIVKFSGCLILTTTKFILFLFFIYDNLIYADWESTVELNKTKQNSEFKTRKKKTT